MNRLTWDLFWLSLSYASNGTTYSYFEEPRPSVEVIEKCKSKLTHLSLVWKTAGGVAEPFFNETTASHAEAGGHQDSGSQLAKPAGPGEEPLETVGQTQDLPVEGSANTWATSDKALIPSRQKTSEAGQGSSREGKGPGGCLSLQDEEKRRRLFYFVQSTGW